MEKIPVVVDRDLEELVPGYLANRNNDVLLIKDCLARDDYETIGRLGHRMKGSGGGYGFEEITVIGGRMEASAGARDASAIFEQLLALKDYLNRVVVSYV